MENDEQKQSGPKIDRSASLFGIDRQIRVYGCHSGAVQWRTAFQRGQRPGRQGRDRTQKDGQIHHEHRHRIYPWGHRAATPSCSWT